MTRKKKPDQKRGSRKNKSEDSHKERLKATAISLVLLKEGKAVICGKCKRPKRPPNREPTGARWEKWGYCDCGRPTEYKPEYCWMIKQRFEERVVEVYYSEKKNFYSVEDEQVFFDEATGNEHGGIKTYERKPEKTSIQFPTFQRWGIEMNVAESTRREWCQKYPEFSKSCEYCEQVIFAFWVERSATGQIVPMFSKMWGQKFFGFTDKVETEIKGEISFLEVVRKSKERRGNKKEIEG